MMIDHATEEELAEQLVDLDKKIRQLRRSRAENRRASKGIYDRLERGAQPLKRNCVAWPQGEGG